MSKRKSFFLVLFLVALCGVAVFAVFRRKRQLASAKSLKGRSIPVQVAPVERRDYREVRRYVGIVTPLNTARVSSRILSEVVELLCDEGDRVKKGQLLIRLDARNLEQEVSAAKANLEEVKTQIAANDVNVKSLKATLAYWKKQLDRDSDLYNQGKIVSDKQLENTKEKVNEAQGKLDVVLQQAKTLQARLTAVSEAYELAKTKMGYARILAPFDALVADVPANVGDLAVPGKNLAVLNQIAERTVDFQIPQPDMRYIKMGGGLEVVFRGKRAKAKITTIYPAVGNNKMKIVKATIAGDADKTFVNGQYVDVYLDLGTISGALVVPSDALNEDNDSATPSYIYVLKNGVLRKVAVEALADDGVSAAVKGPLAVGDKVVVGAFLGWAELADGLKAEETD